MEIGAIKRSDVGAKKFERIALIGGYGAVGLDQGGLSPDATLDLVGVLDPHNKAVSEDAKAEILELLNAEPEDVADTVETLSRLKKDELSAMAVDLGLDGNSFTNKAELAEAIINKRNDSVE